MNAPVLQGYCPKCHESRRPAPQTVWCPQCQTMLIDLREVSDADLLIAVGGVAAADSAAGGGGRGVRASAAGLAPPTGVPAGPPPTAPTAAVASRGRPGWRRRLWLISTGIVATLALLVGLGVAVAVLRGGDKPEGDINIVDWGVFETFPEAVALEDHGVRAVIELHNDGEGPARINEVTVKFYDHDRNVLIARHMHPFDAVLAAGETTFAAASIPSSNPDPGVANDYPLGWESAEVNTSSDPVYKTQDSDEVALTVEGVVEDDGAGLSGEARVLVTGTIRNTSGRAVSRHSVIAYVALHNNGGELVNLGWAQDAEAQGVLEAGETMSFEVTVGAGPLGHVAIVTGAVASPA